MRKVSGLLHKCETQVLTFPDSEVVVNKSVKHVIFCAANAIEGFHWLHRLVIQLYDIPSSIIKSDQWLDIRR